MSQSNAGRPRKYVGPRKTKPVFMPEDLFFKIAASGRNFSAETVQYWELALNSDPLGIKDLETKVEKAEIELTALKGELKEKYRLEEQMKEAAFKAKVESFIETWFLRDFIRIQGRPPFAAYRQNKDIYTPFWYVPVSTIRQVLQDYDDETIGPDVPLSAFPRYEMRIKDEKARKRARESIAKELVEEIRISEGTEEIWRPEQ